MLRASPRSVGFRSFDDEWRRWIAENLLVGNSPAEYSRCAEVERLSPQDSRAKSCMAEQSPYFRGSELLMSRLRKREWILSVYRKLNRLHPDSGEIERQAQVVSRRIPPGVLHDQSARHHHGHDGRLAGHAEVEPRLLRREVRRPRGRGPDESKRGRSRRPVRDQSRAIHRQDQVRRVHREGSHGRPDQRFLPDGQ